MRYGWMIGMVLLMTATAARGQAVGSVNARAFGVQVPAGCDRTVDADGDGLPDCVETNTGVYKSRTDTGTSPYLADSDGDGLSDKDEVYGVPGVALPAMGVDPNHKDLLIEEHWFAENRGCGTYHSHELTNAQRAQIAAFYAHIPLANPNGKNGVHVVFDHGQGGPFSRGGLVPQGLIPTYGHIIEGVYGSDFQALRSALFDPRRHGYFHLYIGAHDYVVGNNSSSSGNAAVNGFEMMVTMQCNGMTHPEWTVATFVHEMGHNLNLNHGGNQTCNWKPNYNSIMNYRYQFSGVDDDCDGRGDGEMDYSYGARPDLDENHLNEETGMCGAPPIDWNNDGQYGTDVAFDTNPLDLGEAHNDCGGVLSVLHDSNDWDRIALSGVSRSYEVPALPAGATGEWGITAAAAAPGQMRLQVQAPKGTCLPQDVSSRLVNGFLIVTLALTDACEDADVRTSATFVKPAVSARAMRLDVCQVNPDPLPTTCATVAGR